MESRKCLKCGEIKPFGDFYRRKGRPESPCKKCVRDREDTPERKKKVAEYMSGYKALPHAKEAKRARDAIYRSKPENQEKHRAYRRQHYLDNMASYKEQARRWDEAHPDAVRASSRRHWVKIKSSPERLQAHLEWRREYQKAQRECKPEFAIENSLRCRVWGAVKLYGDGYKKGRHKKLLGCSPTFLKSHLESLWEEGMSWENYGEWHIDHILPCSAFNLENSEEQEVCFHYTNLQPLWAVENIRKGAKVL